MAHLIDKDPLVAEIDKKLQDLIVCKKDALYPEERVILRDKIVMYKEILSFLDTLEVKEVDLEKEYEEFVMDDPVLNAFDTMGMILARHFFELGLKAKGE